MERGTINTYTFGFNPGRNLQRLGNLPASCKKRPFNEFFGQSNSVDNTRKETAPQTPWKEQKRPFRLKPQLDRSATKLALKKMIREGTFEDSDLEP